MTGIIVQLILSWLLLWYFDRSNLLALGIAPTKSRLLTFVIGLVLSAFVCTTYNLLTTAFVDNGWIIKKQLSASAILASVWWVFKSVLYEELIFRGALLYLAIKRIGATKACMLSAVCFGIYHWFSYNAFGNPMAMLFIFLLTGVAGLMYAYTFAKTKSLYLPVAIHFGWNLIHIVVFSNGPLGQQIFQRINENQAQGLLSLVIFLFQMFALPLLTLGYLKRFTNSQTFSSIKEQQPLTWAIKK